MIKLKSRPAVPPTLTSEDVYNFVESLKIRFEDQGVLKSTDFEGRYWRKDDVKEALVEMHSGKCCYCERKRDEKREPDVEHFRPKAKVTEDTTHPGYWWLAYRWDNYFFSYKKCNEEHKKNQFPLIPRSTRARTPEDNLDEEKPFLINPEKENPEDFIGFEWQKTYGVFVKAVGVDSEGRGDRTIKITGINIGTIPEERAHLVGHLKHIADTIIWAKREDKAGPIQETGELIYNETKSERIFAGFRRDFFRGMGLGEYVANN